MNTENINMNSLFSRIGFCFTAKRDLDKLFIGNYYPINYGVAEILITGIFLIDINLEQNIVTSHIDKMPMSDNFFIKSGFSGKEDYLDYLKNDGFTSGWHTAYFFDLRLI